MCLTLSVKIFKLLSSNISRKEHSRHTAHTLETMAQYTTLEYKKLNGSEPVLMDVYSPTLAPTKDVISLPIVMFFHGGALTVGHRRSYLPNWLKGVFDTPRNTVSRIIYLNDLGNRPCVVP